MFYGSSYSLYTGSERYYALEASAGMYYNFGNIKFRYATSEGNNYNQGYYKAITNGISYNSSTGSSATQTATSLFVKSSVASGVRLITLPEIEKRVGSLRIGMDDIAEYMDPYGVFDLAYLREVPILGRVDCVASYKPYWIASPYRGSMAEQRVTLLDVGYNGSGSLSGAHSEAYGVRPVVSLRGQRLMLTELENGTYTLK